MESNLVLNMHQNTGAWMGLELKSQAAPTPRLQFPKVQHGMWSLWASESCAG